MQRSSVVLVAATGGRCFLPLFFPQSSPSQSVQCWQNIPLLVVWEKWRTRTKSTSEPKTNTLPNKGKQTTSCVLPPPRRGFRSPGSPLLTARGGASAKRRGSSLAAPLACSGSIGGHAGRCAGVGFRSVDVYHWFSSRTRRERGGGHGLESPLFCTGSMVDPGGRPPGSLLPPCPPVGRGGDGPRLGWAGLGGGGVRPHHNNNMHVGEMFLECVLRFMNGPSSSTHGMVATRLLWIAAPPDPLPAIGDAIHNRQGQMGTSSTHVWSSREGM